MEPGGPRALLSAAPCEAMLAAAKRLEGAGWRLIATAEALRALQEAGVQVQDVAEFNDTPDAFPFPPTLHPRMEHALTAEGSDGIDLVYDVPYPLSDGNDVGGHTLLALAVKGGRIPVSDPETLTTVVEAITSPEGLGQDHRRRLAASAALRCAQHFARVAAQLEASRQADLSGRPVRELAEGENPYQRPAHLCAVEDDDPLGLGRFEQLSGGPPCFTNLADLDAVLETLCRLSVACARGGDGRPYLAIAAKHGSPCGIGHDPDSPLKAIEGALWGHPQAIWGGEMVVNFPLDAATARALARSETRRERLGSPFWMLHVVAAPDLDQAAVEVLGRSSDRKLLRNPALAEPTLRQDLHLRTVRGGGLVQPAATFCLELDAVAWPGERPDASSDADLLVAWAAAYTAFVGGNEVALARNGCLLGLGGGPSTVDAAEVAVRRARAAGHDLAGAVFAADAFFPFTDAAEILCEAGVTAGVVPAGGKRHDLVTEFLVTRGIKVGFIPEDYRGFCRH